MPILIYNSLTRKKEEFTPINPPRVNIYTCGVTVYDACHIGHARSLFVFDVIRRYLEYRGYKVNFARNITDIDDKIINRANELKKDWQELVKEYIVSYYQDLEALGVKRGDFEPRATENISEMIKYISVLIEKSFAYNSGGDVYFNVRKFPEYGKLSGQSIDSMLKGVRIEASELKKDPLDFALWKKSKEGEPFWQSPWGRGRPGWHIECSVMSQKFLRTDTLDIHAGGRDLIFPHHENEIAQAEALTGKPFAKYWIHHGLLTINGQKMSKSLGNFVTIKEFIVKHKDANALKMLFLSTHYSHPVDYTEEKIREENSAFNNLKSFIIFANAAENFPGGGELNKIKPVGFEEEIDKYKKEFIAAMDDDFNTPEARATLFKIVSYTFNCVNGQLRRLEESCLQKAKGALIELGELLGLSLLSISETTANGFEGSFINDIEDKIKERNKAARGKDFKRADQIRAELLQKGIILEDTKDWFNKLPLEGTTWRKKP